MLPWGRILRLSRSFSGLASGLVVASQSAQVASIVTAGSGARPGSARVEPLSMIRCQGSASLNFHW